MKKVSLLVVFVISAILCGCKEYSEQQIVMLIAIDKETVTVYCYDYSEKELSYTKKQTENNGVESAILELLSQEDYNLKLCRYAVCDEYIINNEIENVCSALTEAKFSPDIAIIKGDTKESAEYIETHNSIYPLYGYEVTDTGINGVVRDTEKNENIIIINSQIYRTLNKEQSFVFDMLAGNLKNGIYLFEYNNKKYTANLGKISVYYTVTDGILNVNLTVNLKNYKGMSADKNNKEIFEKYLKNNIKENAEQIYKDNDIAEKFNLHWYKNVESYDNVKINVYII